MRLLLVRHGETVDNVASLYAGSRDSALTNHGVLQSRRLAEHLAPKLSPGPPPSPTHTVNGEEPGQPDVAASPPASVTHLFSSNLQRAVKTAEAIQGALGQRGRQAVHLQQLAELREKHFGSGEGQSFAAGAKRDEPHVGAETPAAIRARVDSFLERHLLPLLTPVAEGEHSPNTSSAVVIVAHGIILSVLFRRLCEHCASRVTLDTDVQRDVSPAAHGREVTPSWSNTGYLDATLSSSASPTTPRDWTQVSMHVSRVNVTDHLKGLRKTRGGIGSARFDDKQKTIESFFTKKRKLADVVD